MAPRTARRLPRGLCRLGRLRNRIPRGRGPLHRRTPPRGVSQPQTGPPTVHASRGWDSPRPRGGCGCRWTISALLRPACGVCRSRLLDELKPFRNWSTASWRRIRVPRPCLRPRTGVAALVYRALAVRGLTVGRDIGVISGNNDEALIMGLCPHLTTFDIHPFELGKLAVRQLALRMAGPKKAQTPIFFFPRRWWWESRRW